MYEIARGCMYVCVFANVSSCLCRYSYERESLPNMAMVLLDRLRRENLLAQLIFPD